jgi:histidinol phosphatase-like enzyme
MRDDLIIYFLNHDYNVISDDTNLKPGLEDHFRHIASLFSADFEIKDFTDISLDECIKRDKYRNDHNVGEKVIKDMYDKYIKKDSELLKQNTELKKAVIVDIDGTIAKNVGRGWYDYDKVHEDETYDDIIKLVKMFYEKEYHIIFVTGRDYNSFDVTKKWIEDKLKFENFKYESNWDLLMKPANDVRPDEIIKKEIFFEKIYNKYNVEYVFDDRDIVVKMWRNLGLRTLQVCEGTF